MSRWKSTGGAITILGVFAYAVYLVHDWLVLDEKATFAEKMQHMDKIEDGYLYFMITLFVAILFIVVGVGVYCAMGACKNYWKASR